MKQVAIITSSHVAIFGIFFSMSRCFIAVYTLFFFVLACFFDCKDDIFESNRPHKVQVHVRSHPESPHFFVFHPSTQQGSIRGDGEWLLVRWGAFSLQSWTSSDKCDELKRKGKRASRRATSGGFLTPVHHIPTITPQFPTIYPRFHLRTKQATTTTWASFFDHEGDIFEPSWPHSDRGVVATSE